MAQTSSNKGTVDAGVDEMLRTTHRSPPADTAGPAKAMDLNVKQAAALDEAVEAAAAANSLAGGSPGLDAAVEQAVTQAKQAVKDAGVVKTDAAPAGVAAPKTGTTKQEAKAPESKKPEAITQLDAALAAKAANAGDDEFEDVSSQLQTKATPVATADAPAPAAKPAPASSVAPSAPATPPSPTAAPVAKPTDRHSAKQEDAKAAKKRFAFMDPLLRLIEPLAVRLGAIPAARRQTIGWIAVMTAFNAVCVWGYVLLKSPTKTNYEGTGHATLTGKPMPHNEEPAPESHGEKPSESHGH